MKLLFYILFSCIYVNIVFCGCVPKINSFMTNWTSVRVKWGFIPYGNGTFSEGTFVKMPLTESDAINAGWVLQKDCSQINGRRYIKNNDSAVMPLYDADGVIVGLSSAIPKGLPFNYPSNEIQPYLVDENEYFTVTAYFVNPNTVCKHVIRSFKIGDRLILKGDTKQLILPLTQAEMENDERFTRGLCFPMMGFHYWYGYDGVKPVQITSTLNLDYLVPIFGIYNYGSLNSFGLGFNFNLVSPWYERPSVQFLANTFKEVPNGFSDPTKSNGLRSIHVIFTDTPYLNNC